MPLAYIRGSSALAERYENRENMFRNCFKYWSVFPKTQGDPTPVLRSTGLIQDYRVVGNLVDTQKRSPIDHPPLVGINRSFLSDLSAPFLGATRQEKQVRRTS